MSDNCDFTMAGLQARLPEAFAKVTANTCREIIAKVVEQENKYWAEDEKLDDDYAANAEEEYIGLRPEEEGLESFLEEL